MYFDAKRKQRKGRYKARKQCKRRYLNKINTFIKISF